MTSGRLVHMICEAGAGRFCSSSIQVSKVSCVGRRRTRVGGHRVENRLGLAAYEPPGDGRESATGGPLLPRAQVGVTGHTLCELCEPCADAEMLANDGRS